MFKMTSNHSAEVVFSVPKFKKAAMCLVEKVLCLSELLSGVSYSALGQRFSVNESTLLIILIIRLINQ